MEQFIMLCVDYVGRRVYVENLKNNTEYKSLRK